jgi:hypothetical protein
MERERELSREVTTVARGAMRKKATILMLYASSPTNVGSSGSSAIMASSQRRNVTLKEVTTVASGNGSTTVTLKGMQRTNE